jgi:hypothetical protein
MRKKMTMSINSGSEAILEEILISEVELKIMKLPIYAKIGSSLQAL